jgi:hypothetical protein
VRVAQLRKAVAEARYPGPRVRAMERLAKLVNVHDALLLQASEDGAVKYQIWHEGAQLFLEFKDADLQTPMEILNQFLRR